MVTYVGTLGVNVHDVNLLLDDDVVFSLLKPGSFIATEGNSKFVVKGSGLAYSAGKPTAGIVESITFRVDGKLAAVFSDLGLDYAKYIASGGSEVFRAFRGADTLTGSQFSDFLEGFSGNDTINGRGGVDGLEGGKGNDLIDGGAGFDAAFYEEKTTPLVVTLKGAQKSEVRVGGVVEDTIRNVEGIFSGRGDDRLTGDGKSNVLAGSFGNDKLVGGGGNDVLTGERGVDVLTGGTGSDTFFFETAPSGTEIDTVTDFKAGRDHILMLTPVFKKLGPDGTLNPDFFRLGAKAVDENDYIVYNAANGRLFYDRDGSRTAAEQVCIAKLGIGTVLKSTDIVVDADPSLSDFLIV